MAKVVKNPQYAVVQAEKNAILCYILSTIV